MNIISVESIKQALYDINNATTYQERQGVHSALQKCFDVDGEDINTQGGWDGDFSIKFKLLTFDAGHDINGIEIKYQDNVDNKNLNFKDNMQTFGKLMFLDWGVNANNQSIQRRFLELIATIVYMRDEKVRGYAWLPKFEDEVRELLDGYEIYFDNIVDLT